MFAERERNERKGCAECSYMVWVCFIKIIYLVPSKSMQKM